MSTFHPDIGHTEDEAASFAEVVRRSEQEERRCISRLLHDDLQQILYGLQLELAVVEQMGAPHDDEHELRDRLRAALELLGTAITTVRRITVDLSPPVLREERLRDGLERLRTQMRDLHGLEVELIGEQVVHVQPTSLAVLLAQVVRDVLLNIAYAGSNRATLEVAATDRMLTIAIAADIRAPTSGTEILSTEQLWAGLLAVRTRLVRHGADATVLSHPGESPRLVITAPRLTKTGARRPTNGGR